MSNVVIFGGGTGLSNILKGLKNKDIDLTVVVTVSDNGGSTGKIREFYEIPAPGDLRRAVVALSNQKNIGELMNYRFDDNVQSHTIGNLMLAALVDIQGDISKAVQEYSVLLGVKQLILPVTNENIDLKAIMENGDIIIGETQITSSKQKIKEIYYDDNVQVNSDVINATKNADMIIFSSGSLYTSIISNILFEELADTIRHSKAKKVYVANLMTQMGETDNFTVHDHISEINKYAKGDVIDFCLLNTNHKIDEYILKKYREENAKFVVKKHDEARVKFIEDDLVYVDEKNHARHDYEKIGQYIMDILEGNYE